MRSAQGRPARRPVEAEFGRGFVLGKFMPPHAGHVHLIESAAARCRALTVLVCTVQREAIPGHLRFEWMRRLFPDLDVVHVDEEVPTTPGEHPDFAAIWTALLRRYLPGDVEAFFSSEDYGDDVARWLGIRHVPVDRERRVVPISGSAILAAPWRHRAHVPDVVWPYFVRRVALVGPESTGKTMLAAKLAERLRAPLVAEYGREHTDAVRMPTDFRLGDIETIARVHAERTAAAAARAERVVVCDTEAITTAIWSEIYFGEVPESVRAAVAAQRMDLFLVCGIDCPWVDDGTREFPHLRAWHYARIVRELEERALPYVVLRGSWEEKLDTAAGAVAGLLEG